MKRHLICRADELHQALEVFFRENPGWEDAYICADEDSIMGVRINYEGESVYFETRSIYGDCEIQPN